MILKALVNGEINFTKSENRIAIHISSNPGKIIKQSISNLAIECNVSQPTIIRLCRKLKCEGFPDFKLKLAQEIYSKEVLYANTFSESPSTSDIVKSVMHSIHDTVISITQNFEPQSIDQASKLLAAARSITFFGLGGSGPVAIDAQHKFFRFGIPVIAHTDYINQRMVVSMMSQEDVLVFISFTGRTEEIVKTAKIAKKNNIKTISLTSKNSPLAKLSNVVLHIDAPLENNLHIPMTSRLAHLAIIDILSATVSSIFGNKLDVQTNEVIENLNKTRI